MKNIMVRSDGLTSSEAVTKKNWHYRFRSGRKLKNKVDQAIVTLSE